MFIYVILRVSEGSLCLTIVITTGFFDCVSEWLRRFYVINVHENKSYLVGIVGFTGFTILPLNASTYISQ